MTAKIERFPGIRASENASAWFSIQRHLSLAENTLKAYGRCLEDYLVFCAERGVLPEEAGRDHIALWVADLSHRPNAHGAKVLNIDSGLGYANATMQQRLTAVRLFYDHLIEQGIRVDNPVGRGKYTPGNAFAGKRDRGLLRRYRRLPWIPTDQQWRLLLAAFGGESLRNRLMLLLSYDGALRPSELVAIRLEDIDFPNRQVRLRDEDAKRSSGRVVGLSALTERFLVSYVRHRRELSAEKGPLFLSESRRNLGRPLTTSTWSKVVRPIADRLDLRQFTPHTTRHLRLTHMARAGLEVHEIAAYAGHRSLRSTGIYLHMSGAEIAEKVMRAMAEFDAEFGTGYTTGSSSSTGSAGDNGGEKHLHEERKRRDEDNESGATDDVDGYGKDPRSQR